MSEAAESKKGPKAGSNKLVHALGELSIEDVLPYLSEEQITLLATRFNLEDGTSQRTLLEARETLGLVERQFRAIEREAFEQIYYLRTLGKATFGNKKL